MCVCLLIHLMLYIPTSCIVAALNTCFHNFHVCSYLLKLVTDLTWAGNIQQSPQASQFHKHHEEEYFVNIQ